MSIKDNGTNNRFDIHPTAVIEPGVDILFFGNDNILTIGEGAWLRNPFTVVFLGSSGKIEIGNRCNLRGGVHARQLGSAISIGEKTSFVGVHVYSLEGKSISIGEDCMFSGGIQIRNSDEHPIFSTETDERINPAEDVSIGNRVWIGEGSTIGKGVRIPDGCIISTKAVVSRSLEHANSIYAGTPVKVIRRAVRWERELPFS
jgi:acetyltransferase-like isoleucine patch superfamily enzyme